MASITPAPNTAKHTLSTYVYCFGSSEFAQTTQMIDSNIPVHVRTNNIEKIYAGGWLSAYLSSDGELFMWGSAKDTQKSGVLKDNLAEPTSICTFVQSAALGDHHSLILTKKGQVIAIGPETMFQNQLPDSYAIFAKFNQSAVFTKEDTVVHVGPYGSQIISVPNEIPISMTFYEKGYAVLCKSNKLYMRTEGLPEVVIENVVAATSSREKLLILLKNSRLFHVTPNGNKIQMSGINGTPISVFAGGAHFGCITFEGDCWMWGCGTRGQLGNASFTNSYFPTKILLKDDLKIIDASAGEEHTIIMAVKENNFVPSIPDSMKDNDYMKMVRMSTAFPAAFVASEFDSKF